MPPRQRPHRSSPAQPRGDRHLNRTLHDILLTRWGTCQRIRAYIARRRAEGKTDPEIRCLKRCIARELYRCLNTAMAA